MADASKKRDIGWNYGTQGATKDSVNCNFCGSTFNGGITRHKQHLVGGFMNVKQCTACPSEIREEVRAYMQNKIANNPKFQVRQPDEYIDIDDVDDMDEYAEMRPPSKTPKISSSGGASSTARNVTKGPMNLYFPHKSTQKGGFEKGGGIDETKKILRERAVSAFAIWMYDAGLPFNCVNHKSFDKFIETVGQHGPGMKPPTFHEVRVTHLKKEVEKVEKIVDEHKVQWTKFGCSIMMDKWTARNGKMIINILVNSPIGSVFLGSVDASNESTDSTKMYKLFESIVERIALSRLNDLVYIKYNRTLKRRYDARDLIDPIRLDNIDDSNEWLVGCPEDQEDELVYEDDDLTWGSVATAIGADESIYHLRGLSSRSRALDKGKGVETSSTSSTSSRTRTLIDEDYEEEEDEDQYNDVEDVDLEELDSFEEE
ncbi:hypothetical protein KY290_026376 [Solanum tuberosum]|uniref:DUF659 domain-containing protein n=1 Tax=Solanum tuberosum TaxID=4113 RepID=A0ABQ7UWB6_SOLTU|nr:hypothetical protein KY289_026031 [Solanum tuberosum]KAH0674280.1 hypothetical protein KY284_025367 [Solanum tuberosum]KAH0677431.1 hypothetical protein KY285_025232 [Solanum tuberosum]KAH0756106.1 hypothetical protein KY290_026376 [Solanum tuberosum]